MPIKSEPLDIGMSGEDVAGNVASALKQAKALKEVVDDLVSKGPALERVKRSAQDVDRASADALRRQNLAAQVALAPGSQYTQQQQASIVRGLRSNVSSFNKLGERQFVASVLSGVPQANAATQAQLQQAAILIQQYMERQRQQEDNRRKRPTQGDSLSRIGSLYGLARGAFQGGVGGFLQSTLGHMASAGAPPSLSNLTDEQVMAANEYFGHRRVLGASGGMAFTMRSRSRGGDSGDDIRKALRLQPYMLRTEKIMVAMSAQGIGAGMETMGSEALGIAAGARNFLMANPHTLGIGAALAAAGTGVAMYEDSWRKAKSVEDRRNALDTMVQDQREQRGYGNWSDPLRTKALDRMRARVGPSEMGDTKYDRGLSDGPARRMVEAAWNWRSWWNQDERIKHASLAQDNMLAAFNADRRYGLDIRRYSGRRDVTREYYRNLAYQKHMSWYGDGDTSWFLNHTLRKLTGNSEARLQVLTDEEESKALSDLVKSREERLNREQNNPLIRVKRYENIQHLRAVENMVWENSLQWVQS